MLLVKMCQDQPVCFIEQWKKVVDEVVIYAGLKFLFRLKEATETEIVLKQ